MISTDQIFYQFDQKDKPRLDTISRKILNSWQAKTGLSVDLSSNTIAYNKLSHVKRFDVYESKYKNYFFKLLEENNYNINQEIIDVIEDLSCRIYERSLNCFVVEKYLNSPYIDEIESNENGFTIICDKQGTFTFEYADSYFQNEERIYQYIKKAGYWSVFQNQCHRHVEFLTKENPSLYSVTSFCERKFNGFPCYHSYCLDKNNNKIIDLCSNMVMDKDEYEKLFKCEEIFKIEGSRLGEAKNMAIRYQADLRNYLQPIASTLFQQYIWENNLLSPDETIYSLEPSNPKLLMKNRFGSNK